jgi:hypothetical protein
MKHIQSMTILFLAFMLSGSLVQADALDSEGINAKAVHQSGITGQGVHIGLLSHGNVRSSHAAFERSGGESAVTNHDFTGQGLSRSMHDTNMAGLLISNGSPTHPDSLGIAPGACVHSARMIGSGLNAADLMNTLETLITQHHCRIVVTGVQLPADRIGPDGNSIWSKIYDYYADTYDVFFANAAGNSSSQITVFGDSYNGLTTAGLKKNEMGAFARVGSISNSGPTADGRKKPELAAPSQATAPSAGGDDLWITADPNGLGLTSFAAPFTAGTAALLLEAAARNPAANDDRSEVLKAVMVNTTTSGLMDKKGRSAGQTDSLSVWSPDCGYGKLNAMKAYQTLEAGPIVPEQPFRQRLGWAFGIMPASGQHSYQLEAEKNQRLVFTVTWHRKLNKVTTLLIEEPVRFSLDVKVLSPSGRMVIFETAGRNNLIKTDCRIEETGTYQIILRNPTTAGQRDYGMAFELVSEAQ